MKCKNNCKRCGCPTCCECGPLRPLKHLADAMFYVCKAMGPPFATFMTIVIDGEHQSHMEGEWAPGTRAAEWWAWFDDAMPWVTP